VEITVKTDWAAHKVQAELNPDPQDPKAIVLGGDNEGELVVIVANEFWGRLIRTRLDQLGLAHD
jgi:hypothetical protein